MTVNGSRMAELWQNFGAFSPVMAEVAVFSIIFFYKLKTCLFCEKYMQKNIIWEVKGK